ncbi:TetR/AcrR family transcriptional regulator, partial [Pseudomonas sp. 2822-17]|uniref:TetR/AcrR family transcriptional regulator n=1 Tax=Pseudomonas sp. 2822-17 TaxID=1712678 RepID=UPI00117A0100
MKEKIQKAAITMFVEKGYKGTNVQEIANLAGVNKKYVYSRFSSKKQILKAIYESYLDALYNCLKYSNQVPSARYEVRLNCLKEIITKYVTIAYQHRDFFKLQSRFEDMNDPLLLEYLLLKRNQIHHHWKMLITYVVGEEINHGAIDVS